FSPVDRARCVLRGATATIDSSPPLLRATSTSSPTARMLMPRPLSFLSLGSSAAERTEAPSHTRARAPNIWARIIGCVYPIAWKGARLIPRGSTAYTANEYEHGPHHLPALRRIPSLHTPHL